MSSIRPVLFLAFPNVGEQDLLVPWELLRAVAGTCSGTSTKSNSYPFRNGFENRKR